MSNKIDKEKGYKIDPVKELPNRVRQTKGTYENIIEDLTLKEEGVYLISVGNNRPETVYQQLHKRIKGREDLKLHLITKNIYIEKTAKRTH
jgi:hypothetical protein